MIYYLLIFLSKKQASMYIFNIYKKIIVSLVIILLIFDPLIHGYAFAEKAPLITSIEIKGNRRISEETILSKIKSKEGTLLSKDTIQEDIKRLYKIGYFDDIRVEIEPFEGGVKLIFIFKEKPSIMNIEFEGNKEYEREDLEEKITISPGAVADMRLIRENAQKLEEFYHSEGYWHARVIPLIKEISEYSVSLTYLINEGKKVKLKKIYIEGNNALSDKEIKKVMKTKEWWIFSFITGSGVYSRKKITEDIERIKELYHSKGYIYATVSDPIIRLSDDKSKLYLTLKISEGVQYRIGELKIKGNTVFTEEALRKHITLSSGDIFNRSALRADIDSIIDLYMDKGYARADINPLISVDDEKRLVNITLDINEGDIYRIGRIDIIGNTKTHDKVIRREMRLDEGDIFSKSLLKRSFQRINNLNYFEEVNIIPKPRPGENLIDIDVKVKEKLTGMLSIGGGYSSVDKFMVMGEITQTNLFGKGLKLRLKVDLSSRRSNYNISLTDPWFMDKPISASIGLFNEEIDYIDYDKKATGGYIGFGKEFSEYVGGHITYNLEKATITNVSEDASSLIKEQEGSKFTSSISPSIWRDTRDSFLDPTTGSRNAIYTTIAGLGGDNYYYRIVGDSLWYFPAFWKTVFSVRGRIGYADGYAGKELPLYERFYVGGINTIRGLGFGEGGPRNEEGEKIGGNFETILNTELIFPIIQDIKMKGVIFFDYGGAFDKHQSISFSDMRKTAGFGVRWISPFGPIRLEWGYNLDPREDERRSKLEFSIGGIF